MLVVVRSASALNPAYYSGSDIESMAKETRVSMPNREQERRKSSQKGAFDSKSLMDWLSRVTCGHVL